MLENWQNYHCQNGYHTKKILTEPLKLLKENISNTLHNKSMGNEQDSIAQELRPKINKQAIMKLKSFCTAKNKQTNKKESVNWVRRNPTECEKILVNYSSDSGYTSKNRNFRNKKSKQMTHSEVGLGSEQRIFKRKKNS